MSKKILFFTVLFFALSFVRCVSYAYDAKSIVLIDGSAGRIIYAQNEREKLPMASTTKIMTALIALEEEDIYTEFEVSPEAIKVEGSSMGLKEGDKVSLYILCCGMLLASGNDAANAAAVRIAGSVSAFTEIMNDRAAEMGMKDTVFSSPSGLEEGEHLTTAYDMALLAREAMKNDLFSDICSRHEMKVAFGAPPYERTLVNHNKLLVTDERVVGIKTGYTKSAGRCLVSGARKDGVFLICVTLNCADDWNVHKDIYDEYFSRLILRDVSHEEIFTVPVVNGVLPDVTVSAEKTALSLDEEEYGSITSEIFIDKFVFAPVKEGKNVGYVSYKLNGEEIAVAFLKTEMQVDAKGSVNMIFIWFLRLFKAFIV